MPWDANAVLMEAEDNFTERGLNLIEEVIKLDSREANVPSIGWRETRSNQRIQLSKQMEHSITYTHMQ